jgi:hypothetical protein
MDLATIKAFIQDDAVHRGALFFGGTLKTGTDYENVAAYVVDQAAGDKW